MELLTKEQLSEYDFEYPIEYIQILENNILLFKPWEIPLGERLISRFLGLKKRYPKRKVVPFAHRRDCDDVACFDVENKNIIVIHDYASEGWEYVGNFDTFWQWFRSAIEDMIMFEQG